MLYGLHSPLLSVRALGVAAVAPAGYFDAALWLGGYLGISCMPPTAPHSPCSNRPPANHGFPRSQSSRNHYRISPGYEMFSFAPSTVVQLTGDSTTMKINAQQKPKVLRVLRLWDMSLFPKMSGILNNFCVSNSQPWFIIL